MSLSYYDFKKESSIAVDIETKDPELRLKGNGVYRRDGHILGVSISNGELSEYYDIGHIDTIPEQKEKNLNYLSDQLKHSNNKIFANGLYDIDWLENYQGLKVGGAIDDIQIAEPMLDEYKRSYSLNNLAREYLSLEKDESEMLKYYDNNGWKLLVGDSVQKHLYKMPVYVVEKYACEDTRLTFEIFKKQKQKLIDSELWDLYLLEMGLFPLLLQMRRQGVRLNECKLKSTGLELADLSFDIQEEINEKAGFELNPNSSKDLEKLFIKYGLPVIYGEPTELMQFKGIQRGNPKFDKATLAKSNSPIATRILELRHIKTLLSLFIHPYPDLMVDGRLHCQFNQLRSDEYGTVSGRFSSSNPNLQQVSGKNEEDILESNSPILNGQIIRKLFIPEENCSWLKLDWSQIEYRLIAHYAMGEGSELIRKRYLEDPNVDYHEEMGKLTGIDNRKTIKTLNFGAAYGMGVNRMSAVYGWNLQEAKDVYNMYHSRVPFVKETSSRVAIKAKKVGFIRTVLGRRARLASNDKAYVMFNRLIQGSAADLMKKAMVEAYNAGIFKTLYPHLTVHDELDCSMPNTIEGAEAANELKHIMETCVSLKVPIFAEMEIGKTWGELKKFKDAKEYKEEEI